MACPVETVTFFLLSRITNIARREKGRDPSFSFLLVSACKKMSRNEIYIYITFDQTLNRAELEKSKQKKKTIFDSKLNSSNISFYHLSRTLIRNDDLYLNLDGLANGIQENSKNFFISRNSNQDTNCVRIIDDYPNVTFMRIIFTISNIQIIALTV